MMNRRIWIKDLSDPMVRWFWRAMRDGTYDDDTDSVDEENIDCRSRGRWYTFRRKPMEYNDELEILQLATR